jgi:membrane fusion protein (multidrug efflux system)
MKTEHHKIHPGNIVITIIGIVMVLTGAVYFFRYWQYSNAYEETNDAQVDSYINPVSSRAGGYIRQVRFNEHQMVNKGILWLFWMTGSIVRSSRQRRPQWKMQRLS